MTWQKMVLMESKWTLKAERNCWACKLVRVTRAVPFALTDSHRAALWEEKVLYVMAIDASNVRRHAPDKSDSPFVETNIITGNIISIISIHFHSVVLTNSLTYIIILSKPVCYNDSS